MSLENGKADNVIEMKAPERVAEESSAVPDGVRAFDQNGQEVMVPREEWRTNVLPGLVKETWDQPDQLYMLILNSLSDGFVAEIADAAQHLRKTDPIQGRGVCMWAIVLMQTDRLDEAQRELEEFTAAHGEDGSVLVNLARVYGARGDAARAAATLWRGLEVEPNQDNGLGWYVGEAQERGGETAAREALDRIAALPGSWRAQLWLARGALAAGNLPQAKVHYNEALSRAPRPVPPDLLMQMSGDLGGQGHLIELLELTTPHFVPEMHGLPIGNNLIKAGVDTGNLQFAAAVKDALAKFNRPDWKASLDFWDAEIGRRQAASGGSAGTTAGELPQIQIGMLRVDGPVWLPPGSPARGLFGEKAPGAVVTFLGGTAESPEQPQEVQLQVADALGRLTRSLPMYLAEQVEMRTAAHGRTMVPWAVGQTPGQLSGFVVSSARWSDETAMQAVADAANTSEYVVTVHVDAEVEPWEASLVFVRAADGVRIGELSAEFAPERPEEGLPGLADEMVALLNVLGPVEVPAAYRVPREFGAYLRRLEQLLAVRCATMEGVSPQFLQGEREILEGDLALARMDTTNVPARLLLVETMGAVARVKPDSVEAFRSEFEALRNEAPMAAIDTAFA